MLKMKSLKGCLALLGSLLLGSQGHASERSFWNWFSSNEAALYSSGSPNDSVLATVGEKIREVNPELTFELGSVVDGRRDFVISAGGTAAAFPSVEALYNSAPDLPRWKWIKFRPRRSPINDIHFRGKSVLAKNVRYILAKDDQKIGIILFFDDYSDQEQNTYGQIGFLLLDEALGEYDVEKKVGFIDFQPPGSKYFKDSFPLQGLPEDFDEVYKEQH